MVGRRLQRPRLRSVDANEERRATWMELFFDLVFVVAVAELAGFLEHDVSFEGFLRFGALAVPVWFAWVGAALYATRFDTDDLVGRLLIAIQILAVVALAVNIHDAFAAASQASRCPMPDCGQSCFWSTA